MFVKETHFSSCFGFGNVAKNVKTVPQLYVHVPLEASVLASLGPSVAWHQPCPYWD